MSKPEKQSLPSKQKKRIRVDKSGNVADDAVGGGNAVCQNCDPISIRPTKKKPQHKLGSWRGAFHGTRDY